MRPHASKLLTFILIAVAFVLTADAQITVPTRVPTIDQSLEMHSVSSPRISPDGKRVVYEQTRTDWEANAFETDLWVADVATGETHRLTAMAKSSHDAKWSKDGKWIGFLSNRPAYVKTSGAEGSGAGSGGDSKEDKTQLYVMRAEGGEAQQVTKMENGVNDFEWAPDSKRLAISAEVPESKAMKDRKESFGEYHVIHADYESTQLWLVDLPVTDAAGNTAAIGDAKRLTLAGPQGDAFSVNAFSFSPDGTRIAFSAQRDPDLISGFSETIYTVAVADGSVKKLVETAGPHSDPHWSPDGTQIAFVTSNGAKYYYYANQHVAVVDAKGGTAKVLAATFDEDPGIVAWGPEGIYFSALQKTESGLFLLIPTSDKVIKMETPGSSIADQFTFSKDFTHVAYSGAGANAYAEIYSGELRVGLAGEADACGGAAGGVRYGEARGGAVEVGGWDGD